jgi:hypothetical protein
VAIAAFHGFIWLATPAAIASAIIPSIWPIDLFLLSLRLASFSLSITARAPRRQAASAGSQSQYPRQ